jgi:hypothetical protein
VKGFDVEACDGHAGKVEWASYAPGESYLVVTVHHHLKAVHHVVPAAAVESVAGERVRLDITREQLEQLPTHHDPSVPPSPTILEGWNRGVAKADWQWM